MHAAQRALAHRQVVVRQVELGLTAIARRTPCRDLQSAPRARHPPVIRAASGWIRGRRDSGVGCSARPGRETNHDRPTVTIEARSRSKESPHVRRDLQSRHGLIVLGIVALIFGGAKLPQLARSLGSAKGEFEKGLKEGDDRPRPTRSPPRSRPSRPGEPVIDTTGTVVEDKPST